MGPVEKRCELRFVPWPGNLPAPRRLGRHVMLDIAFVYGPRFAQVTRPFIDSAGDSLLVWVDHHPHPRWKDFVGDPRFVLVDKREAPACPELITPELVGRFEAPDTVLAHADFDGLLSAAKFNRRGIEPYPGADEDARAIDAPGRGYRLSAAGERLALALDYASDRSGVRGFTALLHRCHGALVEGHQPAAVDGELALELATLATAQRARLAEAFSLLSEARAPHPTLVTLRLERALPRSVKKALLQKLEERGRVALIDEAGFVTAGSFHEVDPPLNRLPGLNGGASYAWGHTAFDSVVAAWLSHR